MKSKINVLNNELEEIQDNEKAAQLQQLQRELAVQQKARQFKLSPEKITFVEKVTIDDEVTDRSEFKGVSITQYQST